MAGRCTIHELPKGDNNRCPLRSCVRGSGRRFCPRHGVGFDHQGRCTYSGGCDFTDGPVTHLYHLAPQSLRATIQREGLVPQTPARQRGPQAKRPTPGIYVFCDEQVARKFRPAFDQAKGPCDVWQIDMSDVEELIRDRTAAAESLVVLHPVSARWLP